MQLTQTTSYIKAGLGYYKYSFDDIKEVNSVFGNSNGRPLKPEYWRGSTDILVLYSATKYYYNTVSVNLGIGKEIALKNNWQIDIGIDFANYYTYSQSYTFQSRDTMLRTSRYFGFSANINTAITKRIGKIYIGPSLIIPVYSQWRQDEEFHHEVNGYRNKWLRGIGFGVTFNYSLTNKNK
jgi:hypothetical protein